MKSTPNKNERKTGSVVEEGGVRCTTSGSFYNPAMKHNRDVFISLLTSLQKKPARIGLCMEASGIRSVRVKKELPDVQLFANDSDEKAYECIKKNVDKNTVVSQKDADLFLLEEKGFDVIDIDPYGSPVPFLDSALKRIARNGLLCVSATDLACLCGTLPQVCLRRYGAMPFRGEQSHEIGLRILIRKIQQVGLQYDKAVIPVLAYYKDHYFRVYAQVTKSKSRCAQILKQHEFCEVSDTGIVNGKGTIGPIYSGPLTTYDGVNKEQLFTKLATFSNEKLWNTWLESQVDSCGFLLTYAFSPKEFGLEKLITKLVTKGYKASRTIFHVKGLKTNAPLSVIINCIKNV
jgi:tRNA (guanine26-N2/guanine27-N2)-dimethyltransferase